MKPMLLHTNDKLEIQHCHKLFGKVCGERKYDGERIIAEKTDGQVTLWGRANNKTSHYPEIIIDLKMVPEDNFTIDGEVIVDRYGKDDFPALQSRAHKKEPNNDDFCKNKVSYIAFDMLRWEGKELKHPLSMRKEFLHEFFKCNMLRLSNIREISYTCDLEWLWEQCLEKKWEGIVLKDWNGYYDYNIRSWTWLKMKRKRTYQLAVIGWESKKRVISSLRTEKGKVTLNPVMGQGKEQEILEKIPQNKVEVIVEADADETENGVWRFPIMKNLIIK